MLQDGKHPHHHRDDGEEVPVALDSGKAKRKHISEENHGWTEADGTEDLREEREGHQDSVDTLSASCIMHF